MYPPEKPLPGVSNIQKSKKTFRILLTVLGLI
jgi:hypothetical protein